MSRIDTWLWAVRLFKSRSLATHACKGGHIRRNDEPVKPATKLSVGDIVTLRVPGWERRFLVQEILTKRVGASLAEAAYVELSGPKPAYLNQPLARRDRGAGRPTKKDRRSLDALRGRESTS